MKKILFFILFATLLIGAMAQPYKITSETSYFKVVDSLRSNEIIFHPSSAVRYQLASGDSTVVFYDQSNNRLGPRSISYGVYNCIDRDSLDFTDFASFRDFLDRNTGGLYLETFVLYNFTGDSTSYGLDISGKYTINIDGDFGGGSVDIEHSGAGTSWQNLNSTSYSSDTVINVEGGSKIRVVLSGSSGPDLDIAIDKYE